GSGLRPVDTRNGADLGAVAAEHFFHGIGNLADARLGAGGLDGAVEQVGIALSASGERPKFRLHFLLVALAAEALELSDLLFAHGLVVDLEDLDLGLVGDAVFVHADDGLFAAVDARLRAGGGLLDAHLRDAGRNGLRHAAQ